MMTHPIPLPCCKSCPSSSPPMASAIKSCNLCHPHSPLQPPWCRPPEWITHLGYTQSHHDDLESLAYTIIYSALGDLPWSSNSAGNHEKAILQKKTSIMAEELCKGLPAPFCKFVTYVHSLGFDQKPDYQYLHSILLQCLEAETNQPIKAPPLYLCQVSIDCEPISTGRA